LPDDLSSYIENYIEEYMRPVIERVSMEAAEKVFDEKFSNLQKVPSEVDPSVKTKKGLFVTIHSCAAGDGRTRALA
jgi:hypothetical protein